MKKLAALLAAALAVTCSISALSGFAAEVRRAVDPLGPNGMRADHAPQNGEGSETASFATVESAVPVRSHPRSAVPRTSGGLAADGVEHRPDRFLELAASAEGVAIVSVVSSRSFWSADGSIILTEYSLLVESTLFGEVPQRIQVTGEGGEVGDVGLSVSHAARFRSGHRYAVTLDQLTTSPRVLGDADGLREIVSADRSIDRLLTELQSLVAARKRAEVAR